MPRSKKYQNLIMKKGSVKNKLLRLPMWGLNQQMTLNIGDKEHMREIKMRMQSTQ